MVKNIEIVVSNYPEFPQLIIFTQLQVVIQIYTHEIKCIDFLLVESQ